MEVTTQPSIDPLARAAFAGELPPARPRFDALAGPVALAASLAGAVLAGVLLLGLVGALAGGYHYQPLAVALEARVPATPAGVDAPAADPKQWKKLEGETAKLRAALDRKRPKSSYVVVDRTNNLLYLRDSSGVVLQAVCSAGSGGILKDPAGNRTWVFDTPRGQFKVISILQKPAWRKPDWAFIEEGEPIPKNAADRIEYGVLGEYGLYFGDGFLIHGTLYERLLGRNVTHGCIRLGKQDLRQVVQATRLGTQIYIF
jgi:L,D-transpeptidase YbiS